MRTPAAGQLFSFSKLASNVITGRRRQTAATVTSKSHCISAFNRNQTQTITTKWNWSIFNRRNGNRANSAKMLDQLLPVYASGEVVRGFGRGSKELGIPTANFPLEVVKSLPESLPTGVYYGWANVNNSPVYKMVLSIGWNPFYNNKEKSVETHMLQEFNCDLYGKTLKICIAGYLRPERSFDSLDDLIKAIKTDIDQARALLDAPEKDKLKEATFFKGAMCE